jgi:Predicted membrane protein (DUF2157)
MDDRTRALQDIATLARLHAISASEIATVLEEAPDAALEGRRRAVLVRVLGFLGGTFVFAGLGVFIGLQWDSMSPAARVIVTLGSGLAAFLLGALASRDARFEKAATPMFLVAGALEPTGMLVAFDEFGSGGDWRLAALATSAAMGLQFGATFAGIRRSTPLFLTMFFGALFWWTAFDLLDLDGGFTAVILGASMLFAAVGVDKTPHRDITPVWYLVGAIACLAGLFDLIESTPFEILFLAIAAGFVYLSVQVHSRTLLIVAILAILSYTGWFTRQHFAASIGWPLALIAFGLFMIGLSALAVRIDRDYVRKT